MQTDAILSNKHALLSSLGSKYNDLYYSAANSSVSLIETTFGWANVISLSSLSFGSSSQVNIPVDQFIQEVVLHLRLPNTVANQTLCRGWGYAMLDSVSYILGASNTSNIVLQGDSILQTVLAQCTTKEKRSEVLRLAGDEILSPELAPDAYLDKDIEFIDAYVLLPLPMSTMCDKLPLDSTLLSNNIVVGINFKQGSAIYGGTGAQPSQFLSAEVMLRQGKLSNQAASLRQEMIARPNMIYSYPYIHSQNFVSPTFEGKRRSDGQRACSVNLNSFANADLVGICFWVVAVDNKNPRDSTSCNPWATDEIEDVLVTFNGSTMFRFPYKSYKLTSAVIGEQQASGFDNSYITQYIRVGGAGGSWVAQNTAPFNSRPVESHLVFLDFARLRSACMQDHLFNTFRIPNQNLLIEFNTQYGSTVNYRLHATYMYNAVAEFQGGTSAIYIG